MDSVEKTRARQTRRRPVAARADGVFRAAGAERQRRDRFRQVQRHPGGQVDAAPETETHASLLLVLPDEFELVSTWTVTQSLIPRRNRATRRGRRRGFV